MQAGTHLVAMVAANVWESCESWRVTGQVPEGVRVIAMGAPRLVEGYLMVPRSLLTPSFKEHIMLLYIIILYI